MVDKYISRKMFNKLNMDIDVEKHNKEFIENYLVNYEEYFDNMYKNVDANIKLDKEQRKCILNDEDYMMIMAGAGSGKTTTIAAKVKYLVEKNNVSPSDILMISYTNASVNDLKIKINKELNIPAKAYIDCQSSPTTTILESVNNDIFFTKLNLCIDIS